jgi:O-acetyl-ADP-ribose deacetylase (regulator of RNase III)
MAPEVGMQPVISLHTFDAAMVRAWVKTFADNERVKIVAGDILEGSSGALVSPANSFGYMDGGIDLAYRKFFGMEIQRRVRTQIHAEHFGELPVGQAIVVATDHPRLPFLVVAPTMRVPDQIADTVNVYLAFRAALLAVVRHNGAGASCIERLHAPALGAGVGAMPVDRVARQMKAAYEAVFGEPDWQDDPAEILLHDQHLRS